MFVTCLGRQIKKKCEFVYLRGLGGKSPLKVGTDLGQHRGSILRREEGQNLSKCITPCKLGRQRLLPNPLLQPSLSPCNLALRESTGVTQYFLRL